MEISSEPLDLNKYVNAVRDARAGAIATFAGTTRNSFDGREVLQLEYEAYEAMAIRQMHAICSAAHARWPLIALSCAHRIGIVPISHESVFVAASSVHRADALLACHFIIDEIKSSVPIWKKEVYSDGQVWKENAEFFAKKDSCCRHAGGEMKELSHDSGNLCVDKDAQHVGHVINEDNAEDQCKAIDCQHVGHVISENDASKATVGQHVGHVIIENNASKAMVGQHVINENIACKAKDGQHVGHVVDGNKDIACIEKDGHLCTSCCRKRDSIHDPSPNANSST